MAAGLTLGAALVALWAFRPTPSTPAAVARFTMTVPEGQLLSLPRQAVTISPDGGRIAYAADGRIYVRSLSDIEPRAIAGVESAIGPVFSPDGQSLAFWAPSSVKRVAVAGGPAVTICQTNGNPSGSAYRPSNRPYCSALSASALIAAHSFINCANRSWVLAPTLWSALPITRPTFDIWSMNI